jgi:hypothetical protein
MLVAPAAYYLFAQMSGPRIKRPDLANLSATERAGNTKADRSYSAICRPEGMLTATFRGSHCRIREWFCYPQS